VSERARPENPSRALGVLMGKGGALDRFKEPELGTYLEQSMCRREGVAPCAGQLGM
jgi:hypothetical protein